MRSEKGLKLLVLAAMLGLSYAAVAQSVDDLKRRFPGDDAVMLHSSAGIRSKSKTGSPMLKVRRASN